METTLNTNYDERTLGDLVTENYRRADVFKKFGIDFCCKGKRTLEEACSKKDFAIETLKEALADVDNMNENTADNFDEFELDILIRHIIDKHHNYVTSSSSIISEYMNKVKKVHGHKNPELIEIADLVDSVITELNQHMYKEENILFPYIEEMVQSNRAGEDHTPPPFSTIQNPINMMEAEHEFAGDGMRKISSLSNNYTPPEDACATYRVLFARLKEFEEDLHKHVHLENNILFPKAIELEKELLK